MQTIFETKERNYIIKNNMFCSFFFGGKKMLSSFFCWDRRRRRRRCSEMINKIKIYNLLFQLYKQQQQKQMHSMIINLLYSYIAIKTNRNEKKREYYHII